MLTLIIGGAASGKSDYAEQLVLRLRKSPRYYIATMQAFDAESRARIEKHRKARAHKGFQTLECYTQLQNVQLPQKSVVLLDCLSNLVANELYNPDGAGDHVVETVFSGVAQLHHQSEHVILVSNEVFSGGTAYQGDSMRYLQHFAALHRALAVQADNVCEILCGLPHYHKGKEPGYDPT